MTSAKIIVGKHAGSMYPEGNGYTGALELGFKLNGNRLKRKGRTRTEVKTRLKEAVDDLEKGVKLDRNYRVRDAVNDFLKAFAKSGKSPKTIEVYRTLADHQLIPFIGGIRLKYLTADDVEKWLDGRAENLASSSRASQAVHPMSGTSRQGGSERRRTGGHAAGQART